MTDFNLMILAAGFGKRMDNLTDSTPKPLLKINNKELLRHSIDFFTNLGCKKIIINTHYLHEKIKHCIDQYYSNRRNIIPYYWMPNYIKAHDPSARTLQNYNMS